MKFAAIVVLALASVASARPGTQVFGNSNGNYNLVLPRGGHISRAARVVQAAPVQYVQAVQAPVQYVQAVQAPAVQYVQAAPAVQYVQQAAPVQYVQQAAVQGPITAAVQSQYSLQVIDVPSRGAVAPTQTIVIGPSVQPLDFEFQSQSSPISVRQTHIPGTPNAPQFSSHQDEPDLLKQEIVKPIIHEVTEAIQPFRKITQEVRPVQETINQILTRGQQVQRVQAVQAVQAVAQPAVQVVQAQPAVQVVQAQPIQTIQAVAAPQVSTVELVEEAQPQLVSTIATQPIQLNSLQGFGLSGSLQAIRKKK